MALRIILLRLPNHDREFVHGSQTLHEMLGKLLANYIPQVDAGARNLWGRFSALRQAGRSMIKHVNNCMTARNQIIALGEVVPRKQFIFKLLNVAWKLHPTHDRRSPAPPDDIVAGLTDGHNHHCQVGQHQDHQRGYAGTGRYQRWNP